MLPELQRLMERRIKELESLKDGSLPGDREEIFTNKADDDNKFYGIHLIELRQRTSSVNLYVPDRCSFSAIWTEVIDSLQNFLDELLSIDDELMDVVDALSPQNRSLSVVGDA